MRVISILIPVKECATGGVFRPRILYRVLQGDPLYDNRIVSELWPEVFGCSHYVGVCCVPRADGIYIRI